ncbi:MAG: hypothetical protein DI533_07245 [Cereibacter sphaeroides]|uniref:Uncharacterized protein n=1 Tax=Cereibacter sphaeroides TaxID=1063 RepID=A0A2W5UAG2_CERSP|nr:MAG: hypothetical protein DI533_07245 [Cereibacter sphaeroides]
MTGEPDHISGPTAPSTGNGVVGKQPLELVAGPLLHADAIDSWQEQRWAARAYCREKVSELRKLAEARIEVLSMQELIWETSQERLSLELEILEGIRQAEVHLASELKHVLEANMAETKPLTEYTGWSIGDLGQLALGGSGAAAAVTVAARASPGLLGMIGLGAASAIAAPLTVTVGAAAFAWSAASVIRGKRPVYLTMAQDAVTRLLIAPDCPGGSVLSRHLNRIDQIYQVRRENNS